MVDFSNRHLFLQATGLSYVPMSLDTLISTAIKFCYDNQLTWSLEPGETLPLTSFSIFPELHNDWVVSIESPNIQENICLAIIVAYSNLNKKEDNKVVNLKEWKKK